jgi:hypothetical protein
MSPTQFVSNRVRRGIRWQDSSRKLVLQRCPLLTRKVPCLAPQRWLPQPQARQSGNHPKHPPYSSAFVRVSRWSGGKLFLFLRQPATKLIWSRRAHGGSKSDNGYQICAQTRLASEVPILLMLRGAARNEVVRGFQAGADAYVLVPFDPRELLVRLGALLRRAPAPPANL